MAAESQSYAPRWYVLNHIGAAFQDMARKAVDRFNAWQGAELDIFAPTYVVREERDGQVKMRTASLTFHYVFVRGALPQVKALCAQTNGFSFLIDHSSSERYATVSDRDMAGFQNIARAYGNCLPCFPLDEIDLEEGDLVEVVSGDFPGLVGTYMPRPRSSSGCIVLCVCNNLGAMAFNVKASEVRVLEFSSRGTRANDQIDAIVPHLLQALRYHHAARPLPDALVTKLSVFTSRLGSARLESRKLDARLQALLYGASRILGLSDLARQASARYAKLAPAVTNPWTRALLTLVIAVADNDLAPLSTFLLSLPPSSTAQRQIAAEYAYYTA